MGVSIYLSLCVLCLCLSLPVCVILDQNTSKKIHYVSDPSKLDTLLHKTHNKVLLVLRHQGFTYDISLRKIAHQVWCNHSFAQ